MRVEWEREQRGRPCQEEGEQERVEITQVGVSQFGWRRRERCAWVWWGWECQAHQRTGWEEDKKRGGLGEGPTGAVRASGGDRSIRDRGGRGEQEEVLLLPVDVAVGRPLKNG